MGIVHAPILKKVKTIWQKRTVWFFCFRSSTGSWTTSKQSVHNKQKHCCKPQYQLVERPTSREREITIIYIKNIYIATAEYLSTLKTKQPREKFTALSCTGSGIRLDLGTPKPNRKSHFCSITVCDMMDPNKAYSLPLMNTRPKNQLYCFFNICLEPYRGKALGWVGLLAFAVHKVHIRGRWQGNNGPRWHLGRPLPVRPPLRCPRRHLLQASEPVGGLPRQHEDHPRRVLVTLRGALFGLVLRLLQVLYVNVPWINVAFFLHLSTLQGMTETQSKGCVSLETMSTMREQDTWLGATPLSLASRWKSKLCLFWKGFLYIFALLKHFHSLRWTPASGWCPERQTTTKRVVIIIQNTVLLFQRVECQSASGGGYLRPIVRSLPWAEDTGAGGQAGCNRRWENDFLQC